MQARQRWPDRPGLRNCWQRLENLLLPAHVAARAADSVSAGADDDIAVFCAPQIFGHAWPLFRGLRAELAAAARAALSDWGSPLLPGREVRHHLLDVLHLPAGPEVRAAYQSMGGLACSWRSCPGSWRL